MLILTRRPDESVFILDDTNCRKIEIKFLAVKGSQVRMGIEAPKDIKIYRNEVYDRVLEEKEASKS